MNLQVFDVSNTNIFPIANSALGGQLCTEFNLRSRESVCTNPDVTYMIGPSYSHSLNDFKLTAIVDDGGTVVNSAGFRISAGRALVNGHFVESLQAITVDLQEENIRARQAGRAIVEGQLAIGLRVMYSTSATMIGTMEPEQGSVYKGIQLVILPVAQFKLPEDVPNDASRITAHLKLGEVVYRDGIVLSVVQNPNIMQAFPAARIGDVDQLLSDEYVKKSGLNPKRIYTFSGKGTNPSTGLDTWCDSTDSLIVWDEDPELVSGTTPSGTPTEATFGVDGSGNTYLDLPHKQPDGPITSSGGVSQYYAPRRMMLPAASYGRLTGGVVTPTYTANIRKLQNQLDRLYQGVPNGHLLQYINTLNNLEDLPPVNNSWTPGDYILVGHDNTVVANDNTIAPATIYVVLPGTISNIAYTTSTPSGVELYTVVWSSTISDPTAIIGELLTNYGITNLRGVVGRDYISVSDDSHTYQYKVSAADSNKAYSESIQVTASVPYATTTTLGGFLDIDEEDATGRGYVKIDSEGHLYLVDYDILSSGVLAYRLGDDYATGRGLDGPSIQAALDDTVNERVAFPSDAQILKSKASNIDPSIITVTIDLSDADSEEVINIYGIDSRFNTTVRLQFTGHSTAYTTVNIADCEKIQLIIADDIGDAKFNVHRCGLYYNAITLNRLNNITGLSLWYERFNESDANLCVVDNKVTLLDTPTPTGLEYWTSVQVNDNHMYHGLRSITFAENGHLIACEICIKNATTANISSGVTYSVFKYELPQGVLQYPPKLLVEPLKICGQFLTSYPSGSRSVILDTSFSAVSQSQYTESGQVLVKPGVISFKVQVDYVDNVNIAGLPATHIIDSWSPQAYNTFAGGII